MRGKSIGILVFGLLLFGLGVLIIRLWPEPLSLAANTSGGEQNTALTIALFGDNEGPGPVLDAIIDEANTRAVDLVVQLGDATATSEPDEFTAVAEAFSRFHAPVYPIVGNNDIINNKDRSRWMRAFEKERWYSLERDNTKMIFLDNADRKVGFPDEELAWLRTELENTTAAHTLLFYHRPFSLPLENIFGDDETTASRKTNDALEALLTEFPVDHIYTGHIHSYIPYVVADIPVTVSGGGGALPQAILGGKAAAFYHMLILTITDDDIQQELIPIRLNPA